MTQPSVHLHQILRRILLVIFGVLMAIAINSQSTPAQPEGTSFHPPEIESRERISEIEQTWKHQYEEYLGVRLPAEFLTADEIAATLDRLSGETNQHLALLYIFPHVDQLELLLVIPGIDPILKTLPDVSEDRLMQVVNEFTEQVTRPIRNLGYRDESRQLYDWMIAPIEPELSAQAIDTIVFCVGVGLRSLPIAALWDGDQFLIEKYGLSIIPAFNLTNPNYRNLENFQVLAMGASEFQGLSALPAVPLELRAIAQDLLHGKMFLNQDFTLENLRNQLETQNYRIVHLATHAEFRPGAPHNSYIQLWETERLSLNQVRQINWSEMPVELLVLSACQTALGDTQAELGFAGLSFHAGVKTSLASLWRVSDLGTLALMHEFYWQLTRPDVITKADALRNAQLALIREQVYLSDGYLHGSGGSVPLSEDLTHNGHETFSSPYHWAAFTLVGSPW